ncbi:MAG: hypothetical protein OSA99_10075 [Acidimicrobiales bacterium]|nr:hypothetical protein [Acidimicrobiales bacterium]
MSATSDASRRAGDLLTDLHLWDTVLEQLREEGFSQAQSIKATVERLGVPLADAKQIVHLSAAWADRRSSNDEFHRSLDDAASSSG